MSSWSRYSFESGRLFWGWLIRILKLGLLGLSALLFPGYTIRECEQKLAVTCSVGPLASRRTLSCLQA